MNHISEQGTKYLHVNGDTEQTKPVDRTNGDSSASGKYAVAIGALASAEGENAIAIGKNTQVKEANAVAIGADITKTAENSVNLGAKSAAETDSTDQTAGTTKYESAEIIDKLNGSVAKFAGAEAVGVVTVGDVGSERRIQNVAAGKIEATSTDAVNGSQLYALASAIKNGTAGLVQQAPSSGSTVNNNPITVGAQTGGTEVNMTNVNGETRRITGISAGVDPTDAVNKSQLDKAIGDTNNHINKVAKEARSGIANAVAVASIPQAFREGQSMISAGAGHYKGQSSVAVGMSRISDSGKVIIKFNGSASQSGDLAVGAGVGFAW